jgi:hypothetical protein
MHEDIPAYCRKQETETIENTQDESAILKTTTRYKRGQKGSYYYNERNNKLDA